MSTDITVNGRRAEITADETTPLLYILRNDLKLKGTRFGCGAGHCGACTVIIDGAAVQSCDVPVSAVSGKSITTIEGLAAADKPHVLQQAFVAEQAAQCGYCLSGIIMTAKALLDRNPNPTDEELRGALAGNLCRCGTHVRILRALKRAIRGMQS